MSKWKWGEKPTTFAEVVGDREEEVREMIAEFLSKYGGKKPYDPNEVVVFFGEDL